MRDIETIGAELRLVTALRRAARERGGPLPSIDVADALLDERRGTVRLGVAASAGRPGISFEFHHKSARLCRNPKDHRTKVQHGSSGALRGQEARNEEQT